MKSLSITTIILTYNEEKHIRRCIENIYSISDKIFVVDSISNDNTSAICGEYKKVEFVQHKWPGNQAEQFNWALDNLSIDTEWIMRLDADEYLSDALIEEIKNTIPGVSAKVGGCYMKRDVIFMGKRIRFGKLKPLVLLRLWRKDCAYMEHRLMDEHMKQREGQSIRLKNYFYDDNKNGISAWINKHVDYASREAAMIMTEHDNKTDYRSVKKSTYYSFPKYLRAWLFFIVRYVFLGGFLDGKQGFLWHFFQCLWYRNLVDTRIDELNDNFK